MSGEQDAALGSCAGKIRWGVQIPSAVQKGINIYEHQCFAKNSEELSRGCEQNLNGRLKNRLDKCPELSIVRPDR